MKAPVLDRCQAQYDMLSDLPEDSSRNKKKRSPKFASQKSECAKTCLQAILFICHRRLLLMIYVTNFVGFLPPRYCFSCLCLVIVNLPDCLLRCYVFLVGSILVLCIVESLLCVGTQEISAEMFGGLKTRHEFYINSCLRSCWRGNPLFIFKTY